MSTGRPRSVKSSLAAARAAAAPWGLPPKSPLAEPSRPLADGLAPLPDPRSAPRRPAPSAPPRSTARSTSSAVPTTRSSTPAPAATRSAARRRSGPVAAVRAATARSAAERRVVAVVLAVMGGLMLAVGATGAQASWAESRSRTRIGGTFGRASLAQMEFRARHARFAVWDELAADGVKLPDDLAVVTSNAGPSHWYLRLRDRATGLTCDRIGQLVDDPSLPVTPSCGSAR